MTEKRRKDPVAVETPGRRGGKKAELAPVSGRAGAEEQGRSGVGDAHATHDGIVEIAA
jgi:hypothetical protein